MLTSLFEKFNCASATRFNSRAFDTDSKNRVGDNLNDSGCRISPQRSFYLDKRTGVTQYDRKSGLSINLGELNSACGVVLNAYFDDEGMALILVDTAAALDHKNGVIEE